MSAVIVMPSKERLQADFCLYIVKNDLLRDIDLTALIVLSGDMVFLSDATNEVFLAWCESQYVGVNGGA